MLHGNLLYLPVAYGLSIAEEPTLSTTILHKAHRILFIIFVIIGVIGFAFIKMRTEDLMKIMLLCD